MDNRNRIYFSTLLFAVFFISCTKENSAADVDSLYSHADYKIGVAINFDLLNSDTKYRKIADEQFNSITPENIFKPAYLHPEVEIFYFDDADILADYCAENNKRLHGHTLIWHDQLPDWINNFEGTETDWNNLMKIHIQTIVSHFQGKVASWDVVNEAFNEDGTMRNSIWREKLGDSYIQKAFEYAHQADPDALLFYNDYNLEFNLAKRASVIALLNSIRENGIRIDGIGLQMHASIYYPLNEDIATAFTQISDNNYKIHVSELDISINPFNEDMPNPDATLLQMQAEKLAEIVQNYQQIPADKQFGITVWGISDQHSWIRPYFNRMDYPLLYDDNYVQKPAYLGFKETLIQH